MTKYQWSNSPDWAAYAAMDDDGSCYWYRYQIEEEDGEWYFDYKLSKEENDTELEEIEDIDILVYIDDWKESLEKRPDVIVYQYPNEEPDNYFWTK